MRKRNNTQKSNNGITLIALVITIIILLILAGISIAMLTGSNGLLTKALKAKEEHLISQYQEEINLIIVEEVAERKTEVKEEAMIVSLEGRIRKKDWVNQEKVNQYNEEGITESEPAKNKYLIVESKEGYEFMIEVDNEKETAKIIETNKTPGEKYTITYHPNGADGTEKEVKVRRGFYKILEESTFTKTDYIFAGWCEKQEPDGEATIYLAGSKYQPKSNVILYAIWTHNVATITFNRNTGTGTMDSKEVVKDKETTLPVNSFTKKGYDFEKWNTKADGTGIDYADSGKITINENTTLYAMWKKMTVESAIKKQEVFEENTPITDSYENEVTIPEGFKIATDSAKDVTGGIIIEDATNSATAGSQFVWVPVGTVYMNKEHTQSKTIELNRYTFASNGTYTKKGSNTIESYYQELATSDKGNVTAISIEVFKTSANTNHGYYMGRYEAGDPTAKADRVSYSSKTTPMVCKKEQFVYTYVTQPEAATLARGMYTNKKFTSDLINSYAWDTAIVFIQEFSGDIDYSMQQNLQSTITKTGKAGNGKDVRCNIFDMAGNSQEWTTETCVGGTGPCTHRGGYYYGGKYTAKRGNHYKNRENDEYTFRPILYLKN